MFREIILNGNQVILTMNQLADSRAFLAAIENENIQITYAKPSIYNIEGYSIANEDVYIDQLKL